ncbi:MAG: endonuclease/exonuclease/phosphatase family protein [Bacteroidales bacterium]|nr:endonuclease/exonuclease/phosphatase family protein [Bacteroidales bacterium]MBQ9701976.1 endonuclease/exonuclease/phosphatase family protein [Bacteroidales bacterium]MBR1782428.1 endonuclease/exonuclease/phosphatase family protein [Bacteroidales bacterium]
MAERKKRHWLSRLSFGSVCLLASALLVLAYVSVIVDPAKAWFFTFFGLLYPPVLVFTFGLFVWALIRRSSMRGLLLTVLLPSFFFVGRYYQPHWKTLEGESSLKVVSYNVGLFAHSDGAQDRLALADSVCAFLLKQDADIICLQEFYLPSGENPDRWLRRHFPGYKAEYYLLTGKSGRAGNLTLSRRGVHDRGKEVFEKSTNMAVWTDVKLDSSTVRIYNCHFESYNISLSGLVKGLRNDAFLEETGLKMRRSITSRPKQVAHVLQSMEKAPVRSLAVGDFNDSPLSYTYFRLQRGRKDSFVKAGKGFGATYRALWPLLRIDYILYPKNLEAISFEVLSAPYSDHNPIVATYFETSRGE